MEKQRDRKRERENRESDIDRDLSPPMTSNGKVDTAKSFLR